MHRGLIQMKDLARSSRYQVIPYVTIKTDSAQEQLAKHIEKNRTMQQQPMRFNVVDKLKGFGQSDVTFGLRVYDISTGQNLEDRSLTRNDIDRRKNEVDAMYIDTDSAPIDPQYPEDAMRDEVRMYRGRVGATHGDTVLTSLMHKARANPLLTAEELEQHMLRDRVLGDQRTDIGNLTPNPFQTHVMDDNIEVSRIQQAEIIKTASELSTRHLGEASNRDGFNDVYKKVLGGVLDEHFRYNPNRDNREATNKYKEFEKMQDLAANTFFGAVMYGIGTDKMADAMFDSVSDVSKSIGDDFESNFAYEMTMEGDVRTAWDFAGPDKPTSGNVPKAEQLLGITTPGSDLYNSIVRNVVQGGCDSAAWEPE